MREIKFRAWDGKTMKPVDGRDNYTFDENGFLVHIGEFDSPAPSVMQYTGLKDKNGVEIYEGDIVRAEYIFDSSGEDSDDFENRVIEFKQGSFVIDNFLPSLLSTTLSYLLDDPDFISFEVIGNIHENPELLK